MVCEDAMIRDTNAQPDLLSFEVRYFPESRAERQLDNACLQLWLLVDRALLPYPCRLARFLPRWRIRRDAMNASEQH